MILSEIYLLRSVREIISGQVFLKFNIPRPKDDMHDYEFLVTTLLIYPIKKSSNHQTNHQNPYVLLFLSVEWFQLWTTWLIFFQFAHKYIELPLMAKLRDGVICWKLKQTSIDLLFFVCSSGCQYDIHNIPLTATCNLQHC